MTLEEWEAILNSTRWDFLGEGSYNTTWKSRTPITIGKHRDYFIWKQPHAEGPLSDPARATRKWNLLNSSSGLHAYEYLSTKFAPGWLAPYVGNTPAPDRVRATKILSIYREHRILLLDGCQDTNILMYKGKPVCIDMDFTHRRGSVVSDSISADFSGSDTNDFFNKCAAKGRYPRSVLFINALQYLEFFLSEDQITNEYLSETILERLYILRCAKVHLTTDIMKDLVEENHRLLFQIKVLAYIELYFSPEEIKPEYLAAEFLETVNVLRRANIRLTANMMKGLLELMHFDKANEIDEGHIFEFLNTSWMTSPARHGQQHVIHLAAQYGLPTLVQTLVNNNSGLSDVKNAQNQTPLFLAAANGHDAVVTFLLDKDANIFTEAYYNYNVLNVAIANNRTSTVAILVNAILKKMAKEDIVLPLPLLVKRLHILHSEGITLNADLIARLQELIKVDVATEISDVLFLDFIKAGNIGAPVTPRRRHSIHLAAMSGLGTLCKTLVTSNSDLVNLTDENNSTPLIWAASRGHTDIVSFLVTQGAALNVALQHPSSSDVENDNYTALDLAIKGGFPDIVTMLQRAGAVCNKLLPVITEETRAGAGAGSSVKTISLEFLATKVKVLRQHNIDMIPRRLKRLVTLLHLDTAGEITDEMLLKFFNLPNMTAPANKGELQSIHLAAQYGLSRLVQTLLEHNPALALATDHHNRSPLDLACEKKHTSTITILADTIIKRLHKDPSLPEYLLPRLVSKLQVLSRAERPITEELIERLIELISFDKKDEIRDDLLLDFLDTGRMIAPAINGKFHVIHLAAKHGLVNLFQVLTTNNPALIHVTDPFSKKPLDWARICKQNAVIRFFRTEPLPTPIQPTAAKNFAFFSHPIVECLSGLGILSGVKSPR